MVYGITGWSGGARVPVNYNLRAGQFRTGGFGYWGGNRTIINNFGCNHFMPPEPQCNHGFGVPKWMNIAFLGGMVMQGLGGIMSAIFGNRGGGYGEGYGGYSDGYGGMSAKDYDSLAALQRLYSGKYNIEKVGDEFVAVDKNGKQVTGKTISDLRAKLGGNTDEVDDTDGAGKTTGTRTPTAGEKKQAAESEIALYLVKKYNENGRNLPHKIGGSYDKDNDKYILTYEKDGQTINVPCEDIDDFKEKADKVIQTGNHEDTNADNANGAGKANGAGAGATGTPQTAVTSQRTGGANGNGTVDFNQEPASEENAKTQLTQFNQDNPEYAKAGVTVNGKQFTYGGKTYGTLNEVKTAIQTDIKNYTLDASSFRATDGSDNAATKKTLDIVPKQQGGLTTEYNDGTMNPPTKITVTTANNNTYIYILDGNYDYEGVNYPKYKCISKNGNENGFNKQEYILQNRQLKQYSGMTGYGTPT